MREHFIPDEGKPNRHKGLKLTGSIALGALVAGVGAKAAYGKWGKPKHKPEEQFGEISQVLAVYPDKLALLADTAPISPDITNLLRLIVAASFKASGGISFAELGRICVAKGHSENFVHGVTHLLADQGDPNAVLSVYVWAGHSFVEPAQRLTDTLQVASTAGGVDIYTGLRREIDRQLEIEPPAVYYKSP